MKVELERGRRRGADRCSRCNAVIVSLRGVQVSCGETDELNVACPTCLDADKLRRGNERTVLEATHYEAQTLAETLMDVDWALAQSATVIAERLGYLLRQQ